jgi:Arc/MetJ-type ribon-helix-helix transcriptional regulator
MNDGSERHGHGHDGPHHGDHHHDHRHEGHQRHHHHDGPPDTEFLDLEISKVAYAEASSLTREAVRTLLKNAIEARLRERLGPQLEEIGRIAADEMVDDMQANLAVEAGIAARRDGRQSTEARIREVLHRTATPKAARKSKPRR